MVFLLSGFSDDHLDEGTGSVRFYRCHPGDTHDAALELNHLGHDQTAPIPRTTTASIFSEKTQEKITLRLSFSHHLHAKKVFLNGLYENYFHHPSKRFHQINSYFLID